MPRIPGVPTIDPVNQPLESPQEAGRAGEAIAQAGASANDSALTGLNLDLFLKKAQEKVDEVAASNQYQAADDEYQAQLMKTQNSRDVQDVVQQQQQNLNEIAAQWSKSPASVAIQQNGDRLRSRVELMGQGRQFTLQKQEGDIQLKVQGKTLSADWAGAMALGDTAKAGAAQAAFYTSVDGMVQANLMGDVEASETKRLFRQNSQELQIKNAITNANPDVNYKIAENATRENFPDVPQEALDTFKGQAMEAAERHQNEAKYMDVMHAMTTTLPKKIQQFTNSATGHFNVGAALTDNAEMLAKGEQPEWVANALAQQYDAHYTQLMVGVKDEGEKKKAAVNDLLNGPRPNFKAAEHQMTADKKWFDDNGLTTDYENELRYLHTARAEARSEAEQGRAAEGFDWRLAREKSQAYSTDTFATVTRFINGGGILTESDIRGMSGNGEGQMSKSDVDSAVAAMKARNKNPEYAGALNYLDAYYGIPKGSDPDTVFAQNAQYAASFREFQKAANEHPEKSKMEIMKGIVKGGADTTVIGWTNQIFGGAESTVSSLFSSTPKKPAAPKPTATPKERETKTNSSGDKVKYHNGHWGPA